MPVCCANAAGAIAHRAAESTPPPGIPQPRPLGDARPRPLEFTVVMDETMTSPTAGDEAFLSREEQAQQRPMAPLQVLRCLIVDDNDHFSQAIGDLLAREGLVIIGVASTGSDALRLHDELRPDVTLLDVVLGDESGFDLAERLTAPTYTEPTVVILMSASLDEEEVRDVIADTAAFLPKREVTGSAVREICRGRDLGAGLDGSSTARASAMTWFYPPEP